MTTRNQKLTAERNWCLYVVKGMQQTASSTFSKHADTRALLKALRDFEKTLRKVRYVD